jgi:hypothetical protein
LCMQIQHIKMIAKKSCKFFQKLLDVLSGLC